MATSRFYDGLPEDPYNHYFHKFDDPAGGERKIVLLPDGTPVPYVHSGWGDGGYPVFILTEASGAVCAAYTDFMGEKRRRCLADPTGRELGLRGATHGYF